MILPPLVMIILTVAMSMLSSGGAYVLITAAMTGMTMIFSIVQYFNEKKDCKEKNKKRRQYYTHSSKSALYLSGFPLIFILSFHKVNSILEIRNISPFAGS